VHLKITVDGNVYDVEVEASEPERPAPWWVPAPGEARVPAASLAAGGGPVVAPTAPAGAAPVADESKVCRSPIAGVVTRVTAQPGQRIELSDPLLVLEAMKMETVITAPVAGTIARVDVAAGDAVQGGQVLVEFA
jgi:biotin carboxyl carrier protein